MSEYNDMLSVAIEANNQLRKAADGRYEDYHTKLKDAGYVPNYRDDSWGGGFIQSFNSGMANVVGGIADFTEHELGVGGDLANSLHTYSMLHAPKRTPWQQDGSQRFSWNYLTSADGLANDVGNALGSMVAIAPAAVGAAALAPEGLLAAGAAALASGSLSAMANAGSIIRDNKEAGKTDKEIDETLTKAAPEILATSAAEGIVSTAMLPIKFAGKAALGGTSIAKAAAIGGGETLGRQAVKVTAKSIANSLGESFQEALEQNVQDKYTGKAYTDTWYDPRTWTDDMKNAAFSAAFGSLPLSGFSHTAKAFQGGKSAPKVSAEEVTPNGNETIGENPNIGMGEQNAPHQEQGYDENIDNVDLYSDGYAEQANSFDIPNGDEHVTEMYQDLKEQQEREMKAKKQKALFDEEAEQYYQPSDNMDMENQRRNLFAENKQRADEYINAYQAGRMTRGQLERELNNISNNETSQDIGLSNYVNEKLNSVLGDTSVDRDFDQLNRRERDLYSQYSDQLGEINNAFYDNGGFENEENVQQYKNKLNELRNHPDARDVGFHKVVDSRLDEVHKEEKGYRTAGEEFKEEAPKTTPQETSGRRKRSVESTQAEETPSEQNTANQSDLETKLSQMPEKDRRVYRSVANKLQNWKQEFEEQGGVHNPEAVENYNRKLNLVARSSRMERMGLADAARKDIDALNSVKRGKIGENSNSDTKDIREQQIKAKNSQKTSDLNQFRRENQDVHANEQNVENIQPMREQNTNVGDMSPRVTRQAQPSPRATRRSQAQGRTRQFVNPHVETPRTSRPNLGEYNEKQLNSYMDEVSRQQLGRGVYSEHQRHFNDVKRVIRNAEKSYAEGKITKENYKKRLQNQLKQEKSKNVGLSDFIQSRLEEVDKHETTQQETPVRKRTKRSATPTEETQVKETTKEDSTKEEATTKEPKKKKDPRSVYTRREQYHENIHRYISEATNEDGEQIHSEKEEEIKKAFKKADELIDKMLKAADGSLVLEVLEENGKKFSRDKQVQKITEDYIHRTLNINGIEEGANHQSKVFNVENQDVRDIGTKWKNLTFASRYLDPSNAMNIDTRHIPSLTPQERQLIDKINKAISHYEDVSEEYIRKLKYLDDLNYSSLGRAVSPERMIEEENKFFNKYFGNITKAVDEESRKFFRYQEYSTQKLDLGDVLVNEVLEDARKAGNVDKKRDVILENAQERMVEYLQDYAAAYDRKPGANEGVLGEGQTPQQYIAELSDKLFAQNGKMKVNDFMEFVPDKAFRSVFKEEELHSVYSIIARACTENNLVRVENALTEHNLWKAVKSTNKIIPASVQGNIEKPAGAETMNYVEWSETKDSPNYKNYQKYVKSEAILGLKQFAAKYDFEMANMDVSGTLKRADFREELNKYIYDLPGLDNGVINKILNTVLDEYGRKDDNINSYRDIEAEGKRLRNSKVLSEENVDKTIAVMNFKLAHNYGDGEVHLALTDTAKGKKFIARILSSDDFARQELMKKYMPRWAMERIEGMEPSDVKAEVRKICRNDGLGIQLTTNLDTFKSQLKQYLYDLTRNEDGTPSRKRYSQNELFDKVSLFLMRYPALDAPMTEITQAAYQAVDNFPANHVQDSVFGRYSQQKITNDIYNGQLTRDQLKRLIQVARTPIDELSEADKQVWKAAQDAFTYRAENTTDMSPTGVESYIEEAGYAEGKALRKSSLAELEGDEIDGGEGKDDILGMVDNRIELDNKGLWEDEERTGTNQTNTDKDTLFEERQDEIRRESRLLDGEETEEEKLQSKEPGRWVDREKHASSTDISGLSDEEIKYRIMSLFDAGELDSALKVLGEYVNHNRKVQNHGRWLPRYSKGMQEFDKDLAKETYHDDVWEQTTPVHKLEAQGEIRDIYREYVPEKNGPEKHIVPKSLENVLRKTIKEFARIAEFDKDMKRLNYELFYEKHKKVVEEAYLEAVDSGRYDKDETFRAVMSWAKSMKALMESDVTFPTRTFDFDRGISHQLLKTVRDIGEYGISDIGRTVRSITNLERTYKERMLRAASVGRRDLIPAEVREFYSNPEEDTNILPEGKHQISNDVLDNLPLPKDVKAKFDDAKLRVYDEVLKAQREYESILNMSQKSIEELKAADEDNYSKTLRLSGKAKRDKYMELRKAYEKETGMEIPEIGKVTKKEAAIEDNEKRLKNIEKQTKELEDNILSTNREIKSFPKNMKDANARVQKMTSELTKELKNRKPGDKIGKLTGEDAAFYDDLAQNGTKAKSIIKDIDEIVSREDDGDSYSNDKKEKKLREELEEQGYSKAFVDKLFEKQRRIYKVHKRNIKNRTKNGYQNNDGDGRQQTKKSEELLSAVKAVDALQESYTVAPFEADFLFKTLKSATQFINNATSVALKRGLKSGIENKINDLVALGLDKTLYRTPLDPKIYEQRTDFHGYNKLMTSKRDIMKALNAIGKKEKYTIQSNDYGGMKRVYEKHGLQDIIQKEEDRVNRIQTLLALVNAKFVHPTMAEDVLYDLAREGSIHYGKTTTDLYRNATRFIKEAKETLSRGDDNFNSLDQGAKRRVQQLVEEFNRKMDMARRAENVNDVWLETRDRLKSVYQDGVHSNEFKELNRELMRQRDTKLANLEQKNKQTGRKFVNNEMISKRVNNAFNKGFTTRVFNQPIDKVVEIMNSMSQEEVTKELGTNTIRGRKAQMTIQNSLGKVIAVDITNKEMAKDNVVFIYVHEKGTQVSEDQLYKYKRMFNDMDYKFVVAEATKHEGGFINVTTAPIQYFGEEMASTFEGDRRVSGTREYEGTYRSQQGEPGVRVHGEVSPDGSGDYRTNRQSRESGLRGNAESVGTIPNSQESGTSVRTQYQSRTGTDRETVHGRSGANPQRVEQTSQGRDRIQIIGHQGKQISQILHSVFDDFDKAYGTNVHDTIGKLINDLGIQFVHDPRLMGGTASKQADVRNRIINSRKPYEKTSSIKENDTFARELVHEVSHIVTHMAMHGNINGTKSIIQLAQKGIKSLITETNDQRTLARRNYYTDRISEMIYKGRPLTEINEYIKDSSIDNLDVDPRERLAIAGSMLQEIENSGVYTLDDFLNIDSIHSPETETILHEAIGYHSMTDEGLRDFVHFVNENKDDIEVGKKATQSEVGNSTIEVPVNTKTIAGFPEQLGRFTVHARSTTKEGGGYETPTLVFDSNELRTATPEEKAAFKKFKEEDGRYKVIVANREGSRIYSTHANPETVEETKGNTPLGMLRRLIAKKFMPNGDVRVLSGQLQGNIKGYYIQKILQDTHRMIERYAPEFLDYYKLGQQAEDINSEYTREITQELDGHFKDFGKRGTKDYKENKEEYNRLASEIDNMGREFVQPVNLNGKTYLITHSDKLYETYDVERFIKWQEISKKKRQNFVGEFDRSTGKYVFIASNRELRDVSYMGDKVYTVAMEQSRNLALRRGYSEKVWKAYEGTRMSMLKWLKKAQNQQKQLGMDKKDRIKIRWGYFPHFHDRWGIYEARVGSSYGGKSIVSAIESFQNRGSAVERARELQAQGRKVVVIERGRNYTIPAAHDNFMMDSLELPDTLISEVNENGEEMYLTQNDVENMTGDIDKKKNLIIQTLRQNGFVDGVSITKEQFVSLFNPANYTNEAQATQLQDALTMFSDVDELFRGYNHKMPVGELIQKVENYGGRFKSLARARTRLGKEGYNQDHLNNVYRYMYSMGNYLAWNPFVKLATRQYENVFGVPHGEPTRSHKEDLVAGFISRASGMPNAFDKLLNNLLADLPFGEKIVEKFGDQAATDFLRGNMQLMAMLKLGLRPASFLTQASQLISVAAYYPSSEFKHGLQMMFSPTEEYKRVFRELQLDERMQSYGTDVFEGNQGLFDKTIKGISIGKMIEQSLWFVTKGDVLARKVSAAIEYKRQKEMGKSYQDCIKETRYMTRKINGDNGRMDESALFYGMGMLGRNLTQFKKFPIKQLNLILEMNPKQQAKYFTLLSMLGGVFGFPFMALVTGLPTGNGGGETWEDRLKSGILELDAENPLQAAIAKFLLYGVPGMGGVDLSQSVSLGDIVPDSTNSLLGPTFATYHDVWKALLNYDSMSDKAIATGAALSPAFWNAYQAAKGQFIKRKDLSVNREYNLLERGAKLGGIRLTDDSLLYDINRVKMVEDRGYEQGKKQAIKEYVEDRTPENLKAAYKAGATKADIKKALKARNERKVPIKKRPKDTSELARELAKRHEKLDNYLK